MESGGDCQGQGKVGERYKKISSLRERPNQVLEQLRRERRGPQEIKCIFLCKQLNIYWFPPPSHPRPPELMNLHILDLKQIGTRDQNGPAQLGCQSLSSAPGTLTKVRDPRLQQGGDAPPCLVPQALSPWHFSFLITNTGNTGPAVLAGRSGAGSKWSNMVGSGG